MFCGNSGDPMAHKDIGYISQETVKMFPEIGSLTIHTNGSLGTEETFVQLAQLPVYTDVYFSLDGLLDTLSIYRRNVDFDTVIKNAKVFIEASNDYKKHLNQSDDSFPPGGHAFWKWVDFPFTRHQIEEARELSKELGFDDFVVTDPFNDDMNDDIVKHSNNKVPKFTSYDIKEVETLYDKKYKQMVTSYKTEIKQLKKGYNDIKCKAISNTNNRKEVYIDYDGTIWPCCWTGQMRYAVNFSDDSHENQLKYFWLSNYHRKYSNKYGKTWNSLFYNSLKDIIETDWYANDLVESWGTDTTLRPCLKKCGVCN